MFNACVGDTCWMVELGDKCLMLELDDKYWMFELDDECLMFDAGCLSWVRNAVLARGSIH